MFLIWKSAITRSRNVKKYNCQIKYIKYKMSAMEDVSEIKFGVLPTDSPYVKPFRFYYKQNGVEKNWDLLKVHDSVAIVIYNTTRNVLVVVKQFRPAVYYACIPEKDRTGTIDTSVYPPVLGVTTELCAGIVDKDMSLVDIAREEVMEECGYDVPVERIEKVLSFRSGVGTSGSIQSLFYCAVTDADRANRGGGVGDEIIDVVELTIPQVRQILHDDQIVPSPPGFLFGLLWFLQKHSNV